MNIWSFSSVTGELITHEPVKAIQNPRSTGEYLLPANATGITPLISKDGFSQVFQEGEWQYIIDHRGDYYDESGNAATISELGEEKPTTWTTEPPPPTLAQQFEAVRLALQEAIDEKAQSLEFSNGNSLMLYAGFASPFQEMAQQFAIWEATVWADATVFKDQVISGTVDMITPEGAVTMMPAYPI